MAVHHYLTYRLTLIDSNDIAPEPLVILLNEVIGFRRDSGVSKPVEMGFFSMSLSVKFRRMSSLTCKTLSYNCAVEYPSRQPACSLASFDMTSFCARLMAWILMCPRNCSAPWFSGKAREKTGINENKVKIACARAVDLVAAYPSVVLVMLCSTTTVRAFFVQCSMGCTPLSP